MGLAVPTPLSSALLFRLPFLGVVEPWRRSQLTQTALPHEGDENRSGPSAQVANCDSSSPWKAASVMTGTPYALAFAALPLNELGSAATTTRVFRVTPPGSKPCWRAMDSHSARSRCISPVNTTRSPGPSAIPENDRVTAIGVGSERHYQGQRRRLIAAGRARRQHVARQHVPWAIPPRLPGPHRREREDSHRRCPALGPWMSPHVSATFDELVLFRLGEEAIQHGPLQYGEVRVDASVGGARHVGHDSVQPFVDAARPHICAAYKSQFWEGAGKWWPRVRTTLVQGLSPRRLPRRPVQEVAEQQSGSQCIRASRMGIADLDAAR